MLLGNSPARRVGCRRASLKRWAHHSVRLPAAASLVFAPLGTAPAQASAAPGAHAAAVATTGAADSASLDALVSHAVGVHPAIRAAAARVQAARARVRPAGAWPDPMLMVGIQNLPMSSDEQPPAAHGAAPAPSGPDPMTMKMVGVGQTIRYPGKLSLERRVAEREVLVADAAAGAVAHRVVRDVKDAYYELAFLDRALDIVARNQGVLVNLIRVAEARYVVGTAGQQDVLKARVEASRLAETAVSLGEQRRAALARLNALLDRPSETPVPHATVPIGVARAAVGDSAREIRFVSAALGARAADSPLPPLAELQDLAARQSPDLREHDAMIAAQAARVEFARKDYLPDFDVSLQYGQRSGYPDMVTATVSVPLPIQRRRKQDQLVTAAAADLASLQAERRAKQNEIRAEVARLVSELERQRAQLALYVKGILPQAQASLGSAAASYQVGKVEFLTVLDNQATVFSYETEYFRALSDFARTLAELERVVGREVLK
jgi:cobalt-zinc-cadmium efflux system outer membrane protein